MRRILLFLATNIAILVVLTIIWTIIANATGLHAYSRGPAGGALIRAAA